MKDRQRQKQIPTGLQQKNRQRQRQRQPQIPCGDDNKGSKCSPVSLFVFAQGVGHGVVAFAGLDLLTGLAGDVEGSEGAVDLGVGGGEASEILGSQLVLDLVEGFLKLLAVVADVDDAAACIGGQAFHVACAGV